MFKDSQQWAATYRVSLMNDLMYRTHTHLVFVFQPSFPQLLQVTTGTQNRVGAINWSKLITVWCPLLRAAKNWRELKQLTLTVEHQHHRHA